MATPRWKQGLGAGLAALLLGWLAIVVAPSTAYACSCAPATAEEHFDYADVVASVSLVSAADSEGNPPAADTYGTVIYTMQIDTLVKGEAPPTLRVHSAAHGASCGLEGMRDGADYLLFAQRDPAQGSDSVHASLCGGTTALTSDLLAEVQQVADEQGIEPTTLPGETPAATTEVDDESTETGVDDDASEQSNAPMFAFLIGAAVLLGLMAWWLIRRIKH